MSDLSYDVQWFREHIDQWDEFRADLREARRSTASSAGALPELSDRFPDNLTEVVPKLNSARERLVDGFAEGCAAAEAMRDHLHDTAESYIENNTRNEDEVDALMQELDS